MSLIWRKFRKTGGEDSPSHGGHSDQGAVAQTPFQTGSSPIKVTQGMPSSRLGSNSLCYFISEEDEHLFMTVIGDNKDDHLLVESQFVKTVSDIFNSQSTLPYFLQFLQGWGSDKYARFWLDVISFRSSAETRIRSHVSQSPEDLRLRRDESQHSDRGKHSVRSESEQTCSESDILGNCMPTSKPGRTLLQSEREEIKSQVTSLVLPDLVSNIKNASDVTPLNSPDGPSTISKCNSSFSRDVKDGSSQTVEKSLPFEKSVLESPLKDDGGNNLSYTWTCSRAQKLRQSITDDALRIFQKYLAKDAEYPVGVEDAIREEIYKKIQVTRQDISPDCFEAAQAVVFSLMEREFLPKFLASDYYLKHQIDVFTSGAVRLADLLYSDSALPYFMEYVEQEGGMSMLEFWVTASNFRQQLRQDPAVSDAAQAQSDAMVLYDRYFSLQATCSLGFSDKVRFIVEGNICCEEGPSSSCFDLPLRIILHVLERDFLMGYLSSNLHIKYLGELINTVKTSVELLGRKKRSGSESTCSSEQSSSQGISSHNTLLAMDSSTPHRFRHLDDPTLAMRIDEAQITDPDSLWRRKNFSKLSCGFINELGRFESDLQPEPDRKTGSKISRTLKKFVNMDEYKVKEDMAYKVAELIIKDVTNITLGSQHSSARSSVESSVPPMSPSSVSQDNLSDVFPS